MLGLELNEHNDVTVGVKIRAQHRSEKRQALDVVLPAECRDLAFIDGYGHSYYGTSSNLRLSIPRSSMSLTATRLCLPGSNGNDIVPR